MPQKFIDFWLCFKHWRGHRKTKISKKLWSCPHQFPSCGDSSENWWLCHPMIWATLLKAKSEGCVRWHWLWFWVDEVYWIDLQAQNSIGLCSSRFLEATFCWDLYLWNQGSKSQEGTWILHTGLIPPRSWRSSGVRIAFELRFNWVQYQRPFRYLLIF